MGPELSDRAMLISKGCEIFLHTNQNYTVPNPESPVVRKKIKMCSGFGVLVCVRVCVFCGERTVFVSTYNNITN